MQINLPELAEPLLVSLEHLPHAETLRVGCVPLLEFLEVWVAAESHAERCDRLCARLPESDTLAPKCPPQEEHGEGGGGGGEGKGGGVGRVL